MMMMSQNIKEGRRSREKENVCGCERILLCVEHVFFGPCSRTDRSYKPIMEEGGERRNAEGEDMI